MKVALTPSRPDMDGKSTVRKIVTKKFKTKKVESATVGDVREKRRTKKTRFACGVTAFTIVSAKNQVFVVAYATTNFPEKNLGY